MADRCKHYKWWTFLRWSDKDNGVKLGPVTIWHDQLLGWGIAFLCRWQWEEGLE